MRKVFTLLLIALSFSMQASAQSKKTYHDSILAYQKNYVGTHEVVAKANRKHIHFFPIDESYRVTASFQKINDSIGFDMSTSSGVKKKYYTYGRLTFKLHDSLVQLYVYQSDALMKQPALKDYLFVPFRDATSGFESHGGGRYLEFHIPDIKNGQVTFDFNKAYNPYCAYTTGYNCPLPPIENSLTISIKAGEKNYGKPVH